MKRWVTKKTENLKPVLEMVSLKRTRWWGLISVCLKINSVRLIHIKSRLIQTNPCNLFVFFAV